MSPEQFAYWLQGFAELNAVPPNAEQWQSIRDHLATVFKKVTPHVVGPAIAAPALKPLGEPWKYEGPSNLDPTLIARC